MEDRDNRQKLFPLFYHVTKANADTSGVITISYEIKDTAKCKIIFDGTKIKATKKDVKSLRALKLMKEIEYILE